MGQRLPLSPDLHSKNKLELPDVVIPNQNLTFEIPKAIDIVWMMPCAVLRLPTHFAITSKLAAEFPIRPV